MLKKAEKSSRDETKSEAGFSILLNLGMKVSSA